MRELLTKRFGRLLRLRASKYIFPSNQGSSQACMHAKVLYILGYVLQIQDLDLVRPECLSQT
jgi:hypothetical protein